MRRGKSLHEVQAEPERSAHLMLTAVPAAAICSANER